MAAVSFRPMREEEFHAWLPGHKSGYAEGMTAFAGLTPENAEAKAERDVASIFPDGLATEGVRLWVVEADGSAVGTVFLGVRDAGAWLYDITIDEAQRGRGYGRAAMLALEEEVRGLGFGELGLNVWGGNEIARSLYTSLGFGEVSVGMKKTL